MMRALDRLRRSVALLICPELAPLHTGGAVQGAPRVTVQGPLPRFRVKSEERPADAPRQRAELPCQEALQFGVRRRLAEEVLLSCHDHRLHELRDQLHAARAARGPRERDASRRDQARGEVPSFDQAVSRQAHEGGLQ